MKTKQIVPEGSNPWRAVVVLTLTLMTGMYVGQAQTGSRIDQLKISISKLQPTTTVEVPKVPGQ